MKNFILVFCTLIAAYSLQAQEWQIDLNKAKALAAEQNRNIVLVFQGSDWCTPCIKLDKEILSTEIFQNYAKENFILLKADFPRKKKNKLSEEDQQFSNQLAEKYNSEGLFPRVLVLDEIGSVLGQTGYEQLEPEAYIRLLASFEN